MKRTGLQRHAALQRSARLQRTAELEAVTPRLQRRGQLRRPDVQEMADLHAELSKTCCGKRSFATSKAALAEIRRLRATDRDAYPASVYMCEHDWWHLTSITEDEQLARTTIWVRGELRRRAPLRPVSAKRAVENRRRRAMIAVLYPDQPKCIVSWCPLPADDIHEPLTRARGGSITDEANQVPLCRPHHDSITFDPETTLGWAYELGLLVHSWDAPAAGLRGAA